MRSLGLDKTVVKDLSELPAKQYRQVVSAIFDLLKDPLPHYSRPLSGSAYLRIAVGENAIVKAIPYTFKSRTRSLNKPPTSRLLRRP
jgi:mRNA-degrading endonuclease RelE of RelBE toxin-antitoxin system